MKMIILFDIMKGVFFFFSVIAALVVLRGSMLFGESAAKIATMIVVPGYLVLCGIMVAYIVLQLWKVSHEDDIPSSPLLVKTFVGGLLLGAILAVIYVLI